VAKRIQGLVEKVLIKIYSAGFGIGRRVISFQSGSEMVAVSEPKSMKNGQFV